MSYKDKILYHQVHPSKLFVDWGTTFIALFFFWRHAWIPALLITFLPPIPASFLLIKYANLESIKKSKTGKYLKKYMTKQMEAMRIAGLLIMIIGAWFHIALLLPLGLGVILFGWFRGYIFR